MVDCGPSFAGHGAAALPCFNPTDAANAFPSAFESVSYRAGFSLADNYRQSVPAVEVSRHFLV